MSPMKNMPAKFLIVTALLQALTACSMMAGYFPDKEKDYQFSSEIPALKIPDEISNKGLAKKQSVQFKEDKERVAVMGDVVKAAPASAGTTTAAVEIIEPEKVEPTRVELVKFANDETRLQINKSVLMSWRMISKALTHKGIEITSRDQANGEFTVQFDPNETDFLDETFWDELMFVFAKDHSQEKPYQIKLLARDKITEAVVLDEQGKPINSGGGLSLLKLLATTIKADLADD
jgi:outer membrane protein assembly factor BamC